MILKAKGSLTRARMTIILIYYTTRTAAYKRYIIVKKFSSSVFFFTTRFHVRMFEVTRGIKLFVCCQLIPTHAQTQLLAMCAYPASPSWFPLKKAYCSHHLNWKHKQRQNIETHEQKISAAHSHNGNISYAFSFVKPRLWCECFHHESVCIKELFQT